ncbi:hypothetical protein KP509_1Z051000 [Ceratopteris richardii]|nr:hypothetical protein KP509_1Z051000 [Ceratopteris richardii]
MSAERKISLTSGAALTLALLLLTTGTVFGARSLLEGNNVQETVDVVNNPRGSTGIQNGDEERNVFPGQQPRALSSVICPADDRLSHHAALHRTN